MSAPVLRVVVAGSEGRLGRVAVAAIDGADDVTLAGTITRRDDASAVLRASRADILVDATLAESSRELAPCAARAGVRPVVGVSGLAPEDIAALREACAAGNVGGLVIPNFSLGAALAMRAAEWFAHWLPCLGIAEGHHPDKRDAPSGTALATAARVARAGGGATPEITSERRAGLVAEQRTTFGDADQTLALEHVVRDGAAYAPGILLAIRTVMEQDGLGVGLDTLLDHP